MTISLGGQSLGRDPKKIYNLLKKLRKRYAPTDDTRRHDIQRKYDNLRRVPRQSKETWIEDWIQTVEEMIELDLKTESSAKRDFYDINVQINESNANLCRYHDKNNSLSFAEYATEYLQYYREQAGRSEKSTSRVAFATNASEPTLFGKTVDDKDNGKKKQRDKDCLCGRKHRFEKCYYLIPNLAPPTWKEDPEIRTKIDSLLKKNRRLAQAVERATKRANVEGESAGNYSANYADADAAPEDRYEIALMAHVDLDVIPKPPTHLLHPQAAQHPDVQSFLNSADPILDLNIAAFSGQRVYELRDSWILDNGSNAHVSNIRERFETFTLIEGKSFKTGDSFTQIVGYGTTYAIRTDDQGHRIITRLAETIYAPRFHTNIVSGTRLRRAGILNNEHDFQLQRKGTRECYATYKEIHDMLVLEYNPLDTIKRTDGPSPASHDPSSQAQQDEDTLQNAAFATSKRSKEPKHSAATKALWHERLAHPSVDAIVRLPANGRGVEITDLDAPKPARGEPRELCETCELSEAPKQISRRVHQAETPAKKPFERMHWDLLQVKNPAHNGDKWVAHGICDLLGLHVALTGASKSMIRDAIKNTNALVERKFGLKVKIIRIDVERSLSKEWKEDLERDGYTIEHSAEYTDEQHGGSERAGRTILKKARAIRIGARLLEGLWPEIMDLAVYLTNRTPIKRLNWKSPLVALYEHLGWQLPSLAHLVKPGCRAYVRNPKVTKGRKMDERSFIGYLIGYDSTNIFRCWVPYLNKIIRARDVRFDETKIFDPNAPMPEQELQQLKELVELINVEWMTLPSAQPMDESLYEESRLTQQLIEQPEQSELEPEDGHTEPKDVEQAGHLPTPETTPAPEPTLIDTTEAERAEGAHGTREAERPRGWTAVSADIRPDHIIDGKRSRTPSDRRAVYLTHLDGGLAEMNTVFTTFNAAAATTLKEHQSTLPPPPKDWKELQNHPKGKEFKADAGCELHKLEARGTFKKVPRPQGVRILPLKWVFVYKFDDGGYLLRCKARLCVRGDLQRLSEFFDTRATTLAARIFRALMAITAAFDLDTMQLDSVNAFVNSVMDEIVYCEFPDGYHVPGYCLFLDRALYGLKRSPVLWQEEFSRTLSELGLKAIPEEPCLWTDGKVILFFFVDDIVLLARKEHRPEMEALKTKLSAKYEMRDLGELRWFLNIRIVRDREQRKLWLLQDAYIDKLVAMFKIADLPKAPTPLSATTRELVPYTGQATNQEIYAYQQRIGSEVYPGVITRPDIAAPVSQLGSFLTNPSPLHLEQANNVIAYLRDTKYLCIEYSGRAPHTLIDTINSRTDYDTVFKAASDAAYADDPATRRSSEGYIFMLYGGPIDWRATKQRVVTTSTTEAELVSASHAAKELIWWDRFFRQLGFNPGHELTLYCDNAQTVDLLNKARPLLATKLRHVDIHQHWLRQGVQNKNLSVQWIPADLMPADGLTKPLPKGKHQEFVRLIGMKDKSKELKMEGNGKLSTLPGSFTSFADVPVDCLIMP